MTNDRQDREHAKEPADQRGKKNKKTPQSNMQAEERE
jgi:hypothetical protein